MNGHAFLELFDSYALQQFNRATELIRQLPERVPLLYGAAHSVNPGMGKPLPLRCHEVSRAVGEVLGLQVQDGWHGRCDHSWLWMPNSKDHRDAILDVYAVGRLPMVQLVSLDSATGHYAAGHYAAGGSASLYRESRPRTDIDAQIVTRLVELFRATAETFSVREL
jgi:hypothetical protein